MHSQMVEEYKWSWLIMKKAGMWRFNPGVGGLLATGHWGSALDRSEPPEMVFGLYTDQRDSRSGGERQLPFCPNPGQHSKGNLKAIHTAEAGRVVVRDRIFDKGSGQSAARVNLVYA